MALPPRHRMSDGQSTAYSTCGCVGSQSSRKRLALPLYCPATDMNSWISSSLSVRRSWAGAPVQELAALQRACPR